MTAGMTIAAFALISFLCPRVLKPWGFAIQKVRLMSTQALEKELERMRRKVAVLQKLIDLKCEIRDCRILGDPLIGWEAPRGYDKAAIVDFCEGGFIVYGPSEGAIKEAAIFYIQKKHKRPFECAEQYASDAIFVSTHWLGKLVVGPGMREGEVVGISPEGLVIDRAGHVHYWEESEVRIC